MEMWEQLQILMTELLAVYQRILVLSKQKRKLLVAATPADLTKIAGEEELLLHKAAKIAGDQKQVIHSLGKAFADQTAGPALTDLLPFAPADMAPKLRSIAQESETVLLQLKDQNKLNRQLIEQALNIVNYNINLFSQSAVEPTYSPQGSGGKPIQGQAKLDCRG